MKLILIVSLTLSACDFARCGQGSGLNSLDRHHVTYSRNRRISSPSLVNPNLPPPSSIGDVSVQTVQQTYRDGLMERHGILPASEMNKILIPAGQKMVPFEDHKCNDITLEFFKRQGKTDCLPFQRFGASIATMCRNHWCTNMVPNVVINFARFLEHHTATHGIFREVGSTNRAKKIMIAYNNSPNDLDLSVYAVDILSVANAFMKLFREMQPALFTAPIVDHIQNSNFADLHQVNQLEYAQRIVSVLQPENRATLVVLIRLFESVANTDGNDMTSINIAVCVSQSLLFEKKESSIKFGTSVEKTMSNREKFVARIGARLRPKESGRSLYSMSAASASAPNLSSNSNSSPYMAGADAAHSVSMPNLGDLKPLSAEAALNNPVMKQKISFVDFLINNFKQVFLLR